jgi:glycosyltransferase involved in cell wall biosynthesis
LKSPSVSPVRPLVSVVLPVHNAARTVAAAVRSIQAQTLEDWELIVVDDASTDNSGKLVQAIVDPRIRVVRNATNLGLAASLNRGMAMAAGQYFARMDADDMSFPQRLARQHAFLEANPQVDLVGAGILVMAGSGELAGALRPPGGHQEICAAGCRGHFPLYHPTWFARAAWHHAHPYDPAYRKAQDFELLWRAAKTSTYANVPEALLVYRADPGRIGKRLRTRAYVLRAYVSDVAGPGWPRLRGICLTVLKGMADAFLASPAGPLVRRTLPPAEPAERAAYAKLQGEVN